MSHTPGPWKTRQGQSVANDKGIAVAFCPTSMVVEEGWSYRVSEDEACDNARLIAVAPELLALSYQYANDMRYPPTEDSRKRRLAAVEAVLAKVKS